MAVYVDDAFIPAKVRNGNRFVESRWCHMTADTHDELEAMARRLGLQAAWVQYPGSWKEHYDLTEGKRRQAIAYGAQEVPFRERTRQLLQNREFVLHQDGLW